MCLLEPSFLFLDFFFFFAKISLSDIVCTQVYYFYLVLLLLLILILLLLHLLKYYCRNLSHFFSFVLRVFFHSVSFLLLFANDHGAAKRLPRSRIDERFEIDRAAQSGERVLVAVLVVHAGDIHLDARVSRR